MCFGTPEACRAFGCPYHRYRPLICVSNAQAIWRICGIGCVYTGLRSMLLWIWMTGGIVMTLRQEGRHIPQSHRGKSVWHTHRLAGGAM